MSKDPYLDRSMRGWIVNTARNSLWRVPSWYSVDDLISDGLVCYYKCYNRYKNLTDIADPSDDNKRVFMSLVKTAFSNHIINLSNKRTAGDELPVSQLGTDEAEVDVDGMLPTQSEEATIRLLLASAPKELIQLFELVAKEGRDSVSFLRSRLSWRKDGRRIYKTRKALRETTNEHYCRRLGLDPKKVDLYGMLCNHLGLT